jgi:trimeric autotransporter adhesin
MRSLSFFLWMFVIFFLFEITANAQEIFTVAGGGTGHGIDGIGDGLLATNASLGSFACVAIDHENNIYVADGNRQRIRRIDGLSGIISTIAGTGLAGFNGDNIQATNALLNSPTYVAINGSDDIFIQDAVNNRIRLVNHSTGVIKTYVGNGDYAFNGDSILATSAAISPGPLSFDAIGNLFFFDEFNHRIRKVDTNGIITTIAGTGVSGSIGDGGPANVAEVNTCLGLAIDSRGNIFFQDSSQTIREIHSNSGYISRVAGSGDGIYSPYSGDGVAATNCHICPYGISVDYWGNLLISDACNERIEKVDLSTDIISTVAGNGNAGYTGDGGSAQGAEISYPENVSFDKCDNLYIADFGNKVVRKVAFNPECWPEEVKTVNTNLSISIYPNPVNNELHIDNLQSQAAYIIYNIVCTSIQRGILRKGENTINISSLLPDMYLLELVDDEGNRTVKKVMKE